MLSATELGYQVPNRRLVSGVSLEVPAGSFVVIVGPNGAGKSTLLRMLSGELTPHAGTVRLLGKNIASYKPMELARLRACLAAERSNVFPFSAYEVVLMGRMPWVTGWFEQPSDHAEVERVMRLTETWDLRDRSYPVLSSGERMRVDLARVLAQQPKLLLLDEPTSHLDLSRQIQLMQTCAEWTRDGGAVIAVLHDLNLAARYATHLMLLREGRCLGAGTPDDILTAEIIAECYGISCEIWRHPSGCPWVVPLDLAKSEHLISQMA